MLDMIRRLTGDIIEIGENKLVIDVHGIGYLVRSPVLQNQFIEGTTISLHTYLAVRETALDLYGFSDKSELIMFELLLGVPKVGPKSALQILCQSTPQLLGEAAHKNDPVYLQKLSGIGKKTCENIIQHLNKKLDNLPVLSNNPELILNQTQTDAIDALVSLGYETTTARETILKIIDKDATVNTLVTRALKQIT
jgi:Holliday junction DNA helicase RuvA